MKIENFKMSMLNMINMELDKKFQANEHTMRTILKTANISFLITGANRVQSMLLCELGDSYVQQSQRYVGMGADSYVLHPHFDSYVTEHGNAKELIHKSFHLY